MENSQRNAGAAARVYAEAGSPSEWPSSSLIRTIMYMAYFYFYYKKTHTRDLRNDGYKTNQNHGELLNPFSLYKY